jgi:hopanoid-associated phosphorylase
MPARARPGPRLGVVTGLAAEAAYLKPKQGERILTRAAGACPARAEAAARALAAAGATALASFGLAGGLDPTLRAGTVVPATAVVDADGKPVGSVDAAWHDRLLDGLVGSSLALVNAPLFGADRALLSVAEKAEAFAATGAAAVDMESLGVARAAAELKLPFICVRVVGDTAAQAVPRCAVAGIGADGTRRPIKVAAALLRHPQELGDLIAVAGDSQRAFRRLGRIARLRTPDGPPGMLALV